MKLNIKFNFGQTSDQTREIKVVNVTPDFMTFETSIDENGDVICQPSIDARAVHKHWLENGCPDILDLQSSKNNKFGKSNTTEQLF